MPVAGSGPRPTGANAFLPTRGEVAPIAGQQKFRTVYGALTLLGTAPYLSVRLIEVEHLAVTMG